MIAIPARHIPARYPSVTAAEFLTPTRKDCDDQRAFRQLFTTNYTSLVRQAARLVKNQEVAEEVVSDVFVRVWKNRGQLDIRSSFKPYLHRAVRNQSLDYLRSHAHIADTHDELTGHYIDGQIDFGSPERVLLQDECSLQIDRAVAALPPQCQVIFRLSRDKGLKYREIAQEPGVSIKTVETHMGRAFMVLHHSLRDYQ